jgi:phage tail-like protein
MPDKPIQPIKAKTILQLKKLNMAQDVLNRYHFLVDWGGSRQGFMEVSGLNIEIEAIDYREGSDKGDSVTKIPGIRRYSNITLKRGITKGDNDFFNWINTKQISNIEKRDITISLLNDTHEPTVTWKIRRAFPVNYYGPILMAGGGNVAIETLVLTHDGMSVEVM